MFQKIGQKDRIAILAILFLVAKKYTIEEGMEYIMNIIFFKICSDENEYKKIQQNKRIKNQVIKFISERMNHYKFSFMTKYNLIERIEENNRLIYVIYAEKEKGEREKKEEQKEKKERKILKKINRKILKIENTNLNRGLKIILSKQIKELIKKHKDAQDIQKLTEILQSSVDDKSLYKEVIEDVIKNVIKLKKDVPEEQSMYVLLNSNNGQYIQLINNIIANYKMLNIVTKNYNQFKAMEENAEENFEAVSVLNNKRKSLARSKYIINIDFSNEELIEYCINRTAIIFNISRERTIKLNNFDGIVINNININKQEDEFDIKDYYIENKIYLERILEEIKDSKYEAVGNNASIEILSAIMRKLDARMIR